MENSTNINQLPNINNVSQDDEDNTIHEVLAEIQNENHAHHQGNPNPPLDSIQQMPPNPNTHIPQPSKNMVNNTNNMNSIIDDSIQQQLLQRLATSNNIDNMYSNNPPSKFNQILNELTSNLKDFILIIISFFILQNNTVQTFLTSKLNNINIPYINNIVLAVSQILIILIGRTIL
tara:strand:- start:4598 stop:5125 length:528 start_codon:yes stop_codon:yes gene_type:complete